MTHPEPVKGEGRGIAEFTLVPIAWVREGKDMVGLITVAGGKEMSQFILVPEAGYAGMKWKGPSWFQLRSGSMTGFFMIHPGP